MAPTKKKGVQRVKRRNESERRQLVEECRQSGKPIRVWCRENGIPVTTYTTWSKEVPRETPPELPQSVQWAEITPPIEISGSQPKRPVGPSSSKIRLISGNCKIEVETDFDSALLERGLRVVSRVCC